MALTQLARQGYESYLPLFAAEKLVRRKSTVVQEPMFARYLFVRLDTTGQGQSWSPIRSTVGVSELVCFGSRPARVDDALIATLREREATQQADPITLFAHGDDVVPAGPIQNLLLGRVRRWEGNLYLSHPALLRSRRSAAGGQSFIKIGRASCRERVSSPV